MYNTCKVYQIHFTVYTNIDVRKIGHLNIKTKMPDIEARVLIGWYSLACQSNVHSKCCLAYLGKCVCRTNNTTKHNSPGYRTTFVAIITGYLLFRSASRSRSQIKHGKGDKKERERERDIQTDRQREREKERGRERLRDREIETE